MGYNTQDRGSAPLRQAKYPSAAEIAQALGGYPTGGQWLARCPAHDDKRPSLSITDGHIGQPIFNCKANCKNTAIQDALIPMGLWPEWRPGEKREAPKPRPAPAGPSADELRNRKHARQIWIRAIPFLGDTPAEAYLVSRGIWDAIDAGAPTLRFARLRHPHTHEENVPCLVVPRHDTRTGSVEAVQRIFLTEDGAKYPRKPFVAPDGTEELADAKLSLGTYPDAWAMLQETTDQLVLAEGMESALSASILFERPCWAKCGPFPKEMWLPESVQDVLIAADNDTPIKNGKPRMTSRQKADELAEFIRGTGRRCEVTMPDVDGWDANDALMTPMVAA